MLRRVTSSSMIDSTCVRTVTSTDVNAYIREASSGDFSAKDFRTWAGTVGAAEALAGEEPGETLKQRQRDVVRAVDQVAAHLGNTRAVSRSSYIHPALLQTYLDGQALAVDHRGGRPAGPGHTGLNAVERSVLRFLERPARAQAA